MVEEALIPTENAVLLCNLGTPDEPTPEAVRRYLREFLSDSRVVEIPRIAWLPILHWIILPTRSKKSAEKYKAIWGADGSPLRHWTQRQARRLQGWLGENGHREIRVDWAMRYGKPSIADKLDHLMKQGATRITIVPSYPQYSGTTTGSLFDAVADWGKARRVLPQITFLRSFHNDKAYIGALVKRIEAHWRQNGRADHLVMSFHGVPERTVKLGDPYERECRETARLIAAKLMMVDTFTVSFQSRFGRAKWLEPSTESVLKSLPRKGALRVDVICPGFTTDCLETLEEIAMEGRQTFLEAGGKELRYIPCLNDSTDWIHALGAIVTGKK